MIQRLFYVLFSSIYSVAVSSVSLDTLLPLQKQWFFDKDYSDTTSESWLLKDFFIANSPASLFNLHLHSSAIQNLSTIKMGQKVIMYNHAKQSLRVDYLENLNSKSHGNSHPCTWLQCLLRLLLSCDANTNFFCHHLEDKIQYGGRASRVDKRFTIWHNGLMVATLRLDSLGITATTARSMGKCNDVYQEFNDWMGQLWKVSVGWRWKWGWQGNPVVW